MTYAANNRSFFYRKKYLENRIGTVSYQILKVLISSKEFTRGLLLLAVGSLGLNEVEFTIAKSNKIVQVDQFELFMMESYGAILNWCNPHIEKAKVAIYLSSK